jgi:hypothetical protein
MPARAGSRVLDALRAAAVFREDFGEDWVVPKAAPRYLVLRALDDAVLFTAYGPEGQIIGERVVRPPAAGEALMRELLARGAVEPWRVIPEGTASATRFLDEPAP